MNHYEERLEQQRERLRERAKQTESEGNARLKRADHLMGAMNGQPILVGHHSEKRHRRDIKRMETDLTKGYDALKESKRLESKADNLGQSGISSDDPTAVKKLEGKLADLIVQRDRMKAANAIIRRKPKNQMTPEKVAELGPLVGPRAALELFTPDFCKRVGFPDYALTNIGARIRSIQKRIEELSAEPETIDAEGWGWKVYLDEGENRVCFEYMERIPKGHALRQHVSGWNWSRRFERWQRKATANGFTSARWLIEELKKQAE